MEKTGHIDAGHVGLPGRWRNGQSLVFGVHFARCTILISVCFRLRYLTAHEDVIVYRERQDVPSRPAFEGSTLERISKEKMVRVGYFPDRMPYCFMNQQQHLVGMEVELLHRLAARMQWRLEFVPYTASTVEQQLAAGEIDLIIGGVIMMPERLLRADFTQPYQTATVAIVARDHRRSEFDTWEKLRTRTDLRLGVIHNDLAAREGSTCPTRRLS